VPFPPGGVVDISGRLLAEELSRQLGVNVIVENKVGAGGTISAADVARAPADGYTLLLGGAATHAFAPFVYRQLRYDPTKDFVAVTQFTEGPLALCVNAATGPLSGLPGRRVGEVATRHHQHRPEAGLSAWTAPTSS